MDYNFGELFTATKCINGNTHSITNIEKRDLNVSYEYNKGSTTF